MTSSVRVSTTDSDSVQLELFKFVGVALFKGEYKVRFANDLTRVKTLEKFGNSDISLIYAPHEMTKPDLVSFLRTSELYNKPQYTEAIDLAYAKYNPVAVVKTKKVVSMEELKARAVAKVETVAKVKKVKPVEAVAKVETVA